MLQDYPTPLPDVPIENLDAPAYTRAPTSLPEFQRSQAIQAFDRVDATNRTFNQQFMATMRSEAGGVTSGIDLTSLAQWVSGMLSRKAGGRPVAQDQRKW